ncbi:hypothetical protein KKA95_01950 [Patescibacteria group bacterium]|nr:hypothetical protein [Patescibacteria group bacterium]
MKKLLILLVFPLILVGCGSEEESSQKDKLSKCGDGICQAIEKDLGKCSEDCEQQLVPQLVPQLEMEEGEIVPFTSPLYFTIVMHTEEDTGSCNNPKANIPNYDGDKELMLHFTSAMREFGEMVASHGAKINMGNDWTWSNGVENFDPTFYTDFEAMGHEIDAHAHQSCIKYKGVREAIIDAGGTPTKVASGIKEDEITEELEYLDTIYPDLNILWGVASPGHDEGEEMTGWVWRPAEDNWLEHDPDGKYIHIGHGAYTNSLGSVQEAIANRKDNTINTFAVFSTPREFKADMESGLNETWSATKKECGHYENMIQWWDDFLTEIDKLVAEGTVEYASLTDIAKYFEENEHNLIIDQSEIPRSQESMTDRRKKSGYCSL